MNVSSFVLTFSDILKSLGYGDCNFVKTIESGTIAEKKITGSPPSSDSGFVETDTEVNSATPPKKTAINARQKKRKSSKMS